MKIEKDLSYYEPTDYDRFMAASLEDRKYYAIRIEGTITNYSLLSGASWRPPVGMIYELTQDDGKQWVIKYWGALEFAYQILGRVKGKKVQAFVDYNAHDQSGVPPTWTGICGFYIMDEDERQIRSQIGEKREQASVERDQCEVPVVWMGNGGFYIMEEDDYVGEFYTYTSEL